MGEKMFKKWLHIAANINDSEDLLCPVCSEKSIDHVYIGNLNTRMGYLQVWCNRCLIGIHVSRVKVPDEADMHDFEEKISIPHFKQVTP